MGMFGYRCSVAVISLIVFLAVILPELQAVNHTLENVSHLFAATKAQ